MPRDSNHSVVIITLLKELRPSSVAFQLLRVVLISYHTKYMSINHV